MNALTDETDADLDLSSNTASECEEGATSVALDAADQIHPPQSFFAFLLWYFRMFLLHLSPIWFAMSMGTGITAVILQLLPYQFHGLETIALVFFAITLFFYLFFLFLSVIRFLLWPQVFWLLLLHSTHSDFLGCVSMSLSTIIDFCVAHFIKEREGSFRYFVWALWWLNASFTTILCFGLTFLKTTRHAQYLNSITGIWLLPMVALIVVASAGGVVSETLPIHYAKMTIILSYMMLGAGWSLIFFTLTLYYARLIFHKVPPAAIIITVFIPLGPCAQACFGFLRLASAIQNVYKNSGQSIFGAGLVSPENARLMDLAIQACSALLAVSMWGFAFFWLCMALTIWVDTWMATKLKFNLGWWGACFPMGVYALATIEMGTALDSGSFKVLGVVLTLATIAIWLFLVSLSLFYVARGKLYVYPFTDHRFYEPYLGEVSQPPKSVESKRQYDFVPRNKIPRIWRYLNKFTGIKW